MAASTVEQAITVIGLVTHSWKSYLVPFLELYCDNTRLQYDNKKHYSQMRCYLNLRRQMSGWLILTETTQSYLFFICEYLKCHSALTIRRLKFNLINIYVLMCSCIGKWEQIKLYCLLPGSRNRWGSIIHWE